MDSKRRLSLGDIIRKMNESGHGAGGDSSSHGQEPPSRTSDRAAVRPARSVSHPAQPSFRHQPDLPSGAATDCATAVAPSIAPRAPQQAFLDPAADTSTSPAADTPLSQTMFEEEEEENFDLFKYLSVVMRRKHIIMLVAAAVTAFSIFNFLRAQRYYTAHARLLFEPGQGGIINDYSSYTWYRELEKKLNTHLELIRSRVVLERTAQHLGDSVEPAVVSGGLSIKQGETDGEKNNIIELSFKHPDSSFARDALNQLCRTYIEYHREVNAQEQTRLIVKLEAQIETFERDLQQRESALREFKERNRVVQLSSETNLVMNKLSNMELALQQTQLDLLSSKERLETLRSQIGQQEANVVQSMTFENPYQSKISQLELELNTLSAEYSSDHYKIKTLKQQIDKLKSAMESEIRKEAASQTFVKNPIRESLLQTLVNTTIEVSALEAKRTAQEQIIEKLNAELQGLPAMEQRYAELQRETESLLQTLRILKKKYEEARVVRESLESDLRIFEMAQTPRAAVSSKSSSTVIMGALIGLILGIALAFGIEYLDQTLKDPTEVERSLELPLLGVVPLIEATGSIIGDPEKLAKSMLEPFRALRANCKHLMKTHNMRALMVCSAVKGEGKTTLAVNLAITFAMDGKKVIIVDGDLRRPQVHHYLDMHKETGLSDYLTGKLGLDDIIKHTQHGNLSVITSGERPPNPAELLGTVRFDELMREVRARADIIIYDSPALLPVSDSITMAPKMDGCVMVVRTMWTPVRAAKQAKAQIRRISANVIGGILNGVSHGHGYYPYYYGYYGYHAYKYTYEDENQPRPFSLRKMGLDAEAKAREAIGSMRYALPRRLAWCGVFCRRLVRKPLFWLLCLVLSALIGVRIWIAATHGPRLEGDTELIERVTAPDGGLEAHAGSNASGGVHMPQPRRPVGSTGAFALEAPGLENDEEPPSFMHRDSLAKWIALLKAGDIASLRAMYDPAGFRHPGGSFDEWFDSFARRWMSSSAPARIVSASQPLLQTAKAQFRQTHQGATVVRGTDTVLVAWVMVWSRNGADWKIAGQKSVEGSR
jgi:capsular exopolysaccharide synthesis family protein